MCRIWRGLASVGGVGFLPLAPGTWGSLAALPLCALWASQPWRAYGLYTALLTVVAVVVSDRAERCHGAHDAQFIVIDEVVGMLWTLWAVPLGLWWTLAGFGLFRLFDAGKPGPIGWIDRRVPGGLGVVADDVVAGLCACGVLHGARWMLLNAR